MIAPVHAREEERLASLLGLGILDTPPEPSFDDIARLAAQLCDVPIALVSLVDARRQWFKARVGLAVPETSRDIAFCAHAILGDEPLVVRDALEDPRFSRNPLVAADPNIRFYAGIPLRLESGLPMGTLCVLDRVPRELTAAQREALAALARQATCELALRKRLSHAEARLAKDRALGDGAVGSGAREGQLLDARYRLGSILGAGGMGIVVAAVDEVTTVPVAVKFLLPDAHVDDDALERFAREARALLRVKSPHVARILDAGNLANGAPYIVMERLLGEDLGARLRACGPFAPLEAADLLLQACSGVEAAHASGVLHRDLKPANLFVTESEEGRPLVKVLDFGLAKLWGAEMGTDDTVLTRASCVMGSPHYMAPEQMSGAADLDARADVWGLGVVLYEVLTGALPFEGRSAAEVCARVLREAPVPLRVRNDAVPLAYQDIVARCLARDRDDRFASVRDLARALAPLGKGTAPQCGSPCSPASPTMV